MKINNENSLLDKIMANLNRFNAFFLITVLLAPLATAQLRNPPSPGLRDPRSIFTFGDEKRLSKPPENYQRRLTIKDLIEESKNPPKERTSEQSVRPRAAVRKAVDLTNSNLLVTIPHWSDKYIYQGLTYKYTMVGTDPKRNPTTTTIPTVIIPLRFIFEVGTPVEDWCDPDENCYTRIDDVERSIALEAGNVETILNSPIFKSHPFSVGGVDVGNTQYSDAFQRANFWGSVSNGSQDYHVLLGQPTVMPTLDVLVPNDSSVVALFGGIGDPSVVSASIRADFVREAIENAIRQNGVSPQTLPIVLYSERIALSDPWYFMRGYINRPTLETGFNDVFEVPGGLQTFVASPFLTSIPENVIDHGNVGAYFLSGHILNWINNPFNQNYTPGYVGKNRQCLSDWWLDKLRVDVPAGELPVPPPIPGATPDPSTGFTPQSYTYDLYPGYAIDTEFGRYSLAHGSFIDAYSRQTPTRSPAGRYSFFDVATVTRMPNPNNPDELIIVRGADIPVLDPAPPCVGHVEVEKQALEYPNAVWTRAYGINNGGTIVGDFKDQYDIRHGFRFDGRNYRQIDFPGASFTIPQAVNDRGQIVGAFYDDNGLPHGFLFSQGLFTQIDFPGATDTFVRSINNRGDIVGMYDTTQPVTRGFILQGGQYRTINYPSTDQYEEQQTDVTGINDRGRMVGFSWAFRSLTFSLDGSVFTQLPRCDCEWENDYLRTINNTGQYGGWHTEAFHLTYNNEGLFGYATIYGIEHTIYSNGVFGMNDRGQIVGNYFDWDLWRTVGYVATLPN